MSTQRIREFDLWRPGYQGAVVTVYIAGTTTLALLFTDEALTVAAANPQTLLTGTINGVAAGKLTAPLYTASGYSLSIDTGDVTGIQRSPLTTLVAADASKATVIVPGASTANELEDIVARTVHAEDYGAISTDGSNAATNNTTLTAAIGALPSGGGEVVVPPGTVAFTALTLGAGVVLRGAGRDATTLTCTTGGNCITLNGGSCGLARLTLDGISKVASSVGVFSKGNDFIIFDDVKTERFETGFHAKGGFNFRLTDFFIDGCSTGAKFHGDIDAGGGSDGDFFGHLLWLRGNVSNCTVIGVDLSYEDRRVYNNTLKSVGFSSNTGVALNVNGARHTKFEDCSMSGNTNTIAVNDDSLTTVTDNKVVGLTFEKCRILDGTATFAGTCLNVTFDRCELQQLALTLTAPDNHILLLDTREDLGVTVAGTGSERLIRRNNTNHGASAGITTDAVATKTRSISLVPGQIVYLEAKVIAKQVNSEDRAIYHVACGAVRPGSTLDYDAQTANFTVGQTVTGGTSGATGRILADADAGATGTLTLDNIVGDFQNNEVITDPLGGSADANGTLVGQNAVLDTVGNVSLRTAYETVVAWAAVFVAPGSSDIEFHVTGAAGDTIEWTVDVEVVST